MGGGGWREREAEQRKSKSADEALDEMVVKRERSG